MVSHFALLGHYFGNVHLVLTVYRQVGIRDLSGQIEPTIVGISTSGTVFVYHDVQETLIRGLQDSTLVLYAHSVVFKSSSV